MRLKSTYQGCARASNCSFQYLVDGHCAFRVGEHDYRKWLGEHKSFEYDVCRQVHCNKHREPYEGVAV